MSRCCFGCGVNTRLARLALVSVTGVVGVDIGREIFAVSFDGETARGVGLALTLRREFGVAELLTLAFGRKEGAGEGCS